MRQLTLTVLAVVLVAGCAPTQGKVINSSHRPGWTETTQRCDPDHPDQCTPQVQHYSETYRLRLDDGTDTGWRTVTKAEYQQCDTGDHYPDCAQGDP